MVRQAKPTSLETTDCFLLTETTGKLININRNQNPALFLKFKSEREFFYLIQKLIALLQRLDQCAHCIQGDGGMLNTQPDVALRWTSLRVSSSVRFQVKKAS
jgi:hypothetical protein